MMIFNRFMLVALLWFGGCVSTAFADDVADRAAITARLQGWATAFNAKDGKRVCSIFAKDLIATVPDVVDSSRDALCGRLSALLAKTNVQFNYRPDILEIIISGNLAVVRVNWTLTIKRNGVENSGVEPGMDVFERQPDNNWSIIRFLAFTTKDRTSELAGGRP
jgi:uncharacterized protein (TIGR02246 family)